MSSELQIRKVYPMYAIVFTCWSVAFAVDVILLVPGSYAREVMRPVYVIMIFAIFYTFLAVLIVLLSWAIAGLYPPLRRCLIPAICFGPILSLLLVELFHRSVDAPLSNGGFMRITPPSLWSSFGSDGASCKIIYKTKNGQTGEIALLQVFMDCRPVVIIPAVDGKALLCLYSTDTDIHLLKIDPTKNPKPFPKDSDLNWMVVSSPWHIELGSINDWIEARDYLKAVPLNTFSREAVTPLDLVFMRLDVSQSAKEWLLKMVEQHMYYLVPKGDNQK